jgi:soluble cytochrome b562
MSEEEKKGSAILDEFEALGQQLTAAVKTLWESEDSRKLRQDLREGFEELGRQLDTAVKSAQESEAAKEFGEQVKETVDKARQSDLAGKLEQGIVSGLQGLTDELSKFVGSLQEKEKPETSQETKTEA